MSGPDLEKQARVPGHHDDEDDEGLNYKSGQNQIPHSFATPRKPRKTAKTAIQILERRSYAVTYSSEARRIARRVIEVLGAPGARIAPSSYLSHAR
jgi:hypothetical protein